MGCFRFHAAAPDGHWLNDPNGLVFAEGAYRLFAQHRADPPTFAATGWARLSSDDLLAWRFDGAVILPEGDDWAYSGSVLRSGDKLEAFHTSHRPGGEAQVRRVSDDAGATWRRDPLGVISDRRARNERDPFVFAYGDEWRMIVARPCDWTDWQSTPRSTLAVLRSSDRRQWEFCGAIGPWAPVGVMWEVPVLVAIGDRWVLLVSTVDRRSDEIYCAVRYWLGDFDGSGFAAIDGWPIDGRPLDLGPDFYAAIVNTPGGWPGDGHMMVAWLSSWKTARGFPWPQGAGGPISLPRRLELGLDRLLHSVEPAVSARFRRPAVAVPEAGSGVADIAGDAAFSLRIEAGRHRLVIKGDPSTGLVEISRAAGLDDGLEYHARHHDALTSRAVRTLRLFVDGPAVELFIEPDGQAASIALPAAGAFDVELSVGGVAVPLRWATLD